MLFVPSRVVLHSPWYFCRGCRPGSLYALQRGFQFLQRGCGIGLPFRLLSARLSADAPPRAASRPRSILVSCRELDRSFQPVSHSSSNRVHPVGRSIAAEFLGRVEGTSRFLGKHREGVDIEGCASGESSSPAGSRRGGESARSVSLIKA